MPSQGSRWWVIAVVVAVGAAITSVLMQSPALGQRRTASPSVDLSPFVPGYEGIIFTQIPTGRVQTARARAEDSLPGPLGEGGRLVFLSKDGSSRILTAGFESAADPAVSFDGKRVLFAGKQSKSEPWNIYEMNVDGSGIRQVTRNLGNCRTPLYQSALFYLNDPQPSYQLTFVSDVAGEMNEYGAIPATNLYSARFDGSGLRRLTYGVSSSYGPYQMADGRILFSHWQRSHREHGVGGRIDLFGIHLDGTDYASFSGNQGRRIKHMACTTPQRMAFFIESDQLPWDGAGNLASLSLRRNLHSYKAITTSADGLFHSPSPLPDGSLLVSRRSANGSDTHAIYRLDPRTGSRTLVFSDRTYHSVQAVVVAPRPEPDGHSSVVEDDQNWSKLYCLAVHQTDLNPEWLAPGMAKRLRIIEGLPRKLAGLGNEVGHGAGNDQPQPGANADTLSGMIQKRVLGEVELDEDGSFHLLVPPNIPIQLQTLDGDGMALRTSAWIWTKNKENRGCIGCHEDNELTPENTFPKALGHPAAQLMLPPESRRTVDFRRDLMPILAAKCAQCHSHAAPQFFAEPAASAAGSNDQAAARATYEQLMAPASLNSWDHGQYVDPGRARTSVLVWAILGKNTARPWDRVASLRDVKAMPPPGAPPLTEEEKQTIIEWIDLGAQFHPLPSHGISTAIAKGEQR